ncbi:MAG TPA: serine/threonine-protein kinase [Ktedonobacteraceae bacterium]|nr:serine/threonine-protein kinase [Ktedonobacteraceae bacterium]
MSDKAGQQLGNYRIIRLIGEGGFAQVYLGEHVYLDSQAAIKVLNTQLTSDNVEWFRTEARTIARLVHPNIVRVLDYGVDAMIPFLVLDYAPNGSLRQQHPKGMRVPLSTTVSYVKQVAEALQYAHDEKLIHRDVKPENMLLGRRGEVLLSDFGLVLMAQSTRFQNLQNVAGTLAYIAPEQIQGKPRPASDQYSLGVVVYEWLSGEVLFQGSLTEIISQQLAVPPPPLSSKIPGVSPAVEQVVMTALEKDPKKRFGSIREFALALEQASQADIEQTSVPVPQVGETLQERTLPPSRGESIAVRGEPTLLPKPLSARIAQTEPVGTIVCSYRGHLASVSSLSWSPDGRQIVSVSGEKIVHVWDASTGSKLQLYPDVSDAVRIVAWSSDGARIATAGVDALVRVWDVDSNRLVITYRGHVGDAVNTMAWSPEQQLLASAGNDGTVHVWDAKGGQPVSIYRGHAGAVYGVAWSSDGEGIVSGGSDATVHVWESFTGRSTSLYRGQSARVLSVAWNPVRQEGMPVSSLELDSSSSGRRVACGREDGMVQMWDTVTGREVVAYRHSAPVYVVAWSPDGKRFAFASDDKMVQVWDTTSNLKLFTFQHAAAVRVLAWSPDGKYIASSDGTTIQIWCAP